MAAVLGLVRVGAVIVAMICTIATSRAGAAHCQIVRPGIGVSSVEEEIEKKLFWTRENLERCRLEVW